MVVLTAALLVRGVWIAIEEVRPAVSLSVELDSLGIGEFAAVVSKDDREEFHEDIWMELEKEPVKDIDDGLGVIGRSQEGYLELLLDEMDGKEDGTTLYPFDGIHLSDRKERMELEKSEIVRERPSDPTGLIDFDTFLLSFTWVHTNGPWHVDVAGREKTAVDVGVESALGEHGLIRVMESDMVEGLSITQERGDDGIQMGELSLGDGKTGTRFGFKGIILFLSKGSFIEGFFESASGTVLTGVADIRWLIELWAGIFNVGGAVIDTLTAGPAAPGVAGKAFGADRSKETFVPDIKEAVIESLSQSTGLLIVDMVANLFRDGGTVLA